jgi:NTE family protein
MFERGFLPSLASSPTSVPFRFWAQACSFLFARPEFTDLRALLVKHIDFESLPSLVRPESPVLLVGAADVLEGTFKTFSSAHGEIRPESLLASAAVPNLFPAVWVDQHAYWDGIFSSNPPVTAFLRRRYVGGGAMLPDEIWIIQVNPLGSSTVPERPGDISDRRNQMAGNLSLQHELELIEITNLLIHEHALTDEFRGRIGLDTSEPISVRVINMSEQVLERMDYPSKLSRNPRHISGLIADGETQAERFLSELEQRGEPLVS